MRSNNSAKHSAKTSNEFLNEIVNQDDDNLNESNLESVDKILSEIAIVNTSLNDKNVDSADWVQMILDEITDTHSNEKAEKAVETTENVAEETPKNIENDKYDKQSVCDKKVIMEVRNVSRTYQTENYSTPAVKNIAFDVYEGELLLILGESGCGKTTLLNLLGGMDKPDTGDVICCKTHLATASRKQLTKYRRDHIGFVFQSYNLMPNLTVKQNLEIISELVKDPYKADDMLELVGLSDKKNSYPSQLSGGQQQRVSVARALIKKPELILADEPTAALDYQTGVEVLSVLEAVKEKGTTIIMISHNDEIAKMADRVLRIKNGSIFSIQKNEHPVHAKDLEW